MLQSSTKVIGYFAYLSQAQVLCTGNNACIISGSMQAMERYLTQFHPDSARSHTVRKTRLGEILQGLRLGAAYGFDEESYARFYPLALQAGLPVSAADFDAKGDDAAPFFTVQLSLGLEPGPSLTPGLDQGIRVRRCCLCGMIAS